MILFLASALVRFLRGERRVLPAEVWRDVFRYNWTGDIGLLPSYTDIDQDDLYLITTRRMFTWLCPNYYWYEFDNSYLDYSDKRRSHYSRGIHPRVALMCVAVRHKWFDLLDMDRYPILIGRAAIECNCVELLRILAVDKKTIDLSKYQFVVDPAEVKRSTKNLFKTIMDYALDLDALDVAKFLVEMGLISRNVKTAGKAGYETILWLHEHPEIDVAWTADVMDDCAARGDLRAVQWLHEHRSEGCTEWALSAAILRDHTETALWLLENRDEQPSSSAMQHLARTGRLDMIKTIVAKFPKLVMIQLVMDAAAEGGQLQTLQWLNNSGASYGFSKRAFDGALAGKHESVLQWLVANSTEKLLAETGPSMAAAGGLDVLKAAVAKFPRLRLTRAVMDEAVTNERIPVIDWLCETGMEQITPTTVEQAIHANRTAKFIEWLLEGCTGAISTATILKIVTQKRVDLLQQVHRYNNGVRFTAKVMDEAAATGSLETVQWLHANRSEGCTKKAVESAIKHKHWDVAAWLLKNRSEGCTPAGVLAAIEDGHADIVKLLHAHAGTAFPKNAAKQAIKHGHEDLAEWLEAHPRK
ncbi:hypothetical protein BC831DRAFT_509782 [Entophlyctis helioformis]|nr:hypothetical protein BC831DRAFT_509782 [Entophlyctis helioformis]